MKVIVAGGLVGIALGCGIGGAVGYRVGVRVTWSLVTRKLR